MEHGILALFGPSDPLLGSHIASICDALDIPHLESRNDIEDAGFNEFSLNLHPSQDLMNQAYRVREICSGRPKEEFCLSAESQKRSYPKSYFLQKNIIC